MQFDKQADIYDKRTGLGEKTVQNIASSIKQIIQPYLNGQFLDIGAGTGEIGYFLQDLATPYIGIDLSKEMLNVYRNRFDGNKKIPHLIQMDGNTPWPLKDHSVSVFFSSRAMHQLDQIHVLNQLKKLSSTSSILILGNVKRNKKSTKAFMRKEMHEILNEFGLKEKSGQSHRNHLFKALEQQGGERLPTITASCWQVSHAPIDSINSWKSVDGIAGQAIEPSIKKQILETLILKAQEKFTDLNQALETEETYELNAITLPYNQKNNN
ncbi:MAG: methyltransferase domain-containing protein [Methylococcales bacterium]|nr:methyltransferase domain-containing protein [Methylococcales bacterium]